MLSVMQPVAVWASVALFSYLVMWADVFDQPREALRREWLWFRKLLAADCTICTSVHTTALLSIGYEVTALWRDDLPEVSLWTWVASPFIGGASLLAFKFLAIATLLAESYTIVDTTEEQA